MISLMTNLVLAILGLVILVCIIHFVFYWRDKKLQKNPYQEHCRYCFNEQSAFFDYKIWYCSKCAKKCICGKFRPPGYVSCEKCYQKDVY